MKVARTVWSGGKDDDEFKILPITIFDKGYRGIIFDIDMTLVPHGYDATKKVEELFKTIHV